MQKHIENAGIENLNAVLEIRNINKCRYASLYVIYCACCGEFNLYSTKIVFLNWKTNLIKAGKKLIKFEPAKKVYHNEGEDLSLWFFVVNPAVFRD